MKWLIIFFSLSLWGQPSSTQAILVTTCSVGGATVQASESNTFSTLVPDVDPGLFAGSNLLNRSGSGVSPTNPNIHYFVLGTRKVEGGVSRSLKAQTTYYYRFDCGGLGSTFSLTTGNIGVGDTRGELPQYDPSTGLVVTPTIPSDTTTKIWDAQTGLQFQNMWLTGD